MEIASIQAFLENLYEGNDLVQIIFDIKLKFLTSFSVEVTKNWFAMQKRQCETSFPLFMHGQLGFKFKNSSSEDNLGLNQCIWVFKLIKYWPTDTNQKSNKKPKPKSSRKHNIKKSPKKSNLTPQNKPKRIATT